MKKVMNGRIAMTVTVTALCLTGCGTEGLLQEETAIGGENLSGMVEVEETEGTKEIVPANVFEGLHYTISIPAEGMGNDWYFLLLSKKNRRRIWCQDS